jgi:hypothetical protein
MPEIPPPFGAHAIAEVVMPIPIGRVIGDVVHPAIEPVAALFESIGADIAAPFDLIGAEIAAPLDLVGLNIAPPFHAIGAVFAAPVDLTGGPEVAIPFRLIGAEIAAPLDLACAGFAAPVDLASAVLAPAIDLASARFAAPVDPDRAIFGALLDPWLLLLHALLLLLDALWLRLGRSSEILHRARIGLARAHPLAAAAIAPGTTVLAARLPAAILFGAGGFGRDFGPGLSGDGRCDQGQRKSEGGKCTTPEQKGNVH